MIIKNNVQDEKLLELYRVTLTNAADTPEVLKALEQSGYSSETLNQGQQMLDEAKTALSTCLKNRALKLAANQDFQVKKEALAEVFHNARTKAKLVFRNDPAKIALLGINHAWISTNYVDWIVTMKKFYGEIAADPQIQQDLARLNITMEQINEGLAKIAEVEAKRAHYIKVKGESEDSTEIKDKAIDTMRDWMFEFYRIAKLELRNNPQLLESLGKVVKSQ